MSDSQLEPKKENRMRFAATLAQSGAKTDSEKSPPVPWNDLVGNTLIGRDLVSSDSEGEIRGPILRVERVGGRIEVELRWAASSILDFEGDPTDEWEVFPRRQTSFSESDTPRRRQDGALVIYCELDARHWTSTVILPPGNNLDPGKVQGL